jgi:hypothetical protein
MLTCDSRREERRRRMKDREEPKRAERRDTEGSRKAEAERARMELEAEEQGTCLLICFGFVLYCLEREERRQARRAPRKADPESGLELIRKPPTASSPRESRRDRDGDQRSERPASPRPRSDDVKPGLAQKPEEQKPADQKSHKQTKNPEQDKEVDLSKGVVGVVQKEYEVEVLKLPQLLSTEFERLDKSQLLRPTIIKFTYVLLPLPHFVGFEVCVPRSPLLLISSRSFSEFFDV